MQLGGPPLILKYPPKKWSCSERVLCLFSGYLAMQFGYSLATAMFQFFTMKSRNRECMYVKWNGFAGG